MLNDLPYVSPSTGPAASPSLLHLPLTAVCCHSFHSLAALPEVFLPAGLVLVRSRVPGARGPRAGLASWEAETAGREACHTELVAPWAEGDTSQVAEEERWSRGKSDKRRGEVG